MEEKMVKKLAKLPAGVLTDQETQEMIYFMLIDLKNFELQSKINDLEYVNTRLKQFRETTRKPLKPEEYTRIKRDIKGLES